LLTVPDFGDRPAAPCRRLASRAQIHRQLAAKDFSG